MAAPSPTSTAARSPYSQILHHHQHNPTQPNHATRAFRSRHGDPRHVPTDRRCPPLPKTAISDRRPRTISVGAIFGRTYMCAPIRDLRPPSPPLFPPPSSPTFFLLRNSLPTHPRRPYKLLTKSHPDTNKVMSLAYKPACSTSSCYDPCSLPTADGRHVRRRHVEATAPLHPPRLTYANTSRHHCHAQASRHRRLTMPPCHATMGRKVGRAGPTRPEPSLMNQPWTAHLFGNDERHLSLPSKMPIISRSPPLMKHGIGSSEELSVPLLLRRPKPEVVPLPHRNDMHIKGLEHSGQRMYARWTFTMDSHDGPLDDLKDVV